MSTRLDILVLRFVALMFATVSARLAWFTFQSDWRSLVAAQGFTVMSICVLAILRARIGGQQTYRHPVGLFTVLLLLPAQLLTLSIPALATAR